jgi:hypothetical protein
MLAAPFLAAGLVDRVLAYVDGAAAQGQPSEALPWPLLPPGFTMTAVTRTEGFARIEALRPR